MATDLPGYRILVTMLIADCYVIGQYGECLDLINRMNSQDQDVLVLLVKGRLVYKVNVFVNWFHEVACRICGSK